MSYSKYRGQCHGRLLHCLHTYCEYHRIGDSGMVGNGKVMLGDTLVATYEWPEDHADDKPEFTFLPSLNHFSHEKLHLHFAREQFLKKPYLDDSIMLLQIRYIVQEARKLLTFDEALAIRHVRDVLNRDFSAVHPQSMIESIHDRIIKVIMENTHKYKTLEEVEQCWQHVALCTIYEI